MGAQVDATAGCVYVFACRRLVQVCVWCKRPSDEQTPKPIAACTLCNRTMHYDCITTILDHELQAARLQPPADPYAALVASRWCTPPPQQASAARWSITMHACRLAGSYDAELVCPWCERNPPRRTPTVEHGMFPDPLAAAQPHMPDYARRFEMHGRRWRMHWCPVRCWSARDPARDGVQCPCHIGVAVPEEAPVPCGDSVPTEWLWVAIDEHGGVHTLPTTLVATHQPKRLRRHTRANWTRRGTLWLPLVHQHTWEVRAERLRAQLERIEAQARAALPATHSGVQRFLLPLQGAFPARARAPKRLTLFACRARWAHCFCGCLRSRDARAPRRLQHLPPADLQQRTRRHRQDRNPDGPEPHRTRHRQRRRDGLCAHARPRRLRPRALLRLGLGHRLGREQCTQDAHRRVQLRL